MYSRLENLPPRERATCLVIQRNADHEFPWLVFKSLLRLWKGIVYPGIMT